MAMTIQSKRPPTTNINMGFKRLMRYWIYFLSFMLFLHLNTIQAEESSWGPTSEKEAQVLWVEGQKSLENEKFQEAISYFRRLIDRYPAQEGYFQAHSLLGQAYLEMGQPEKAIPLLQFFISNQSDRVELAKARLILGHCYIHLKKYDEAYLLTNELNQQHKKQLLPLELRLESLIIQAHASFGLHQNLRTELALDAAEKKMIPGMSSRIKGLFNHLKLSLKIRMCEQFPSQKLLSDGQLQNQMERRGLCLQESLIILKKVIQSQHLQSIQGSFTELSSAFRNYRDSCLHPFQYLAKVAKNKRTPSEEKSYREELTDFTFKNCLTNNEKALGLLENELEKIKDQKIVSELLEAIFPKVDKKD